MGEVLEPVQERLALGVMPPDIARVTVALESMRRMPSMPLLFEVYSTISELYFIPYLKYVSILHQVALFLECFTHPPFETLIANVLNA